MLENSLRVWNQKEIVGELQLATDGRMISFKYDRQWIKTGRSISISLPVEEEEFPAEQGKAHLWFGNLLPEEGSRAALVKRLGVADDDFSLLRALGGDCAGALTILPLSEEPGELQTQTPIDEKLLGFWASGHERYSLIVAKKSRLSLAGAQDKIPVIIENGKIFMPEGVTPSSHILKFSNTNNLILNELSMNTLARLVGLPNPANKIERSGRHAMLAVERYDRHISQGTRYRIHQEDFCQALGISRSSKYQTDQGPSLSDCAGLIRKSTKFPAKDLQQLIRWQIFNVLAGNSDGHAKNLSLLQDTNGAWNISPSYDLVCTRVLPFDSSLAFAVGEQFNPQQVIMRDWNKMAKGTGVSASFVLKEVATLAQKILNVLHSEQYKDTLFDSGMDLKEWDKIQHIRKYITGQCTRTLKQELR